MNQRFFVQIYNVDINERTYFIMFIERTDTKSKSGQSEAQQGFSLLYKISDYAYIRNDIFFFKFRKFRIFS